MNGADIGRDGPEGAIVELAEIVAIRNLLMAASGTLRTLFVAVPFHQFSLSQCNLRLRRLRPD